MRIDGLEAHVAAVARAALAAHGLPDDVNLAPAPNPEMGDLGLPCFAFAKAARKAPPVIAQELAGSMGPDAVIASVEAAGPYVNFRFRPEAMAAVVLGQALREGLDFGGEPAPAEGQQTWLVEYSSPNTNKPQHLGHIRNNLLGFATSQLLAAVGHRVIKANLVNDRGIHICKSMLAYLRWGQGVTPESAGKKGDHLVGEFYVMFESRFREEYAAWLGTEAASGAFAEWLETGAGRAAARAADKDPAAPPARAVFDAEFKADYFNAFSELGAAAKEMLRQWEAGDEATVALWKQMNGWVLDGFRATYARLGVAFDKYYFESDTYLLGKQIVREGLERGALRKLDDGAVVMDLDRIGLEGQKVLLRSDGTSVYMTQDLGTAAARFDEYDLAHMVYVVGDEQEYHFQVLFGVLSALRPELDGACTHLSYGMVLLPEGKMKSREGTVVDADDLMDEMTRLARVEIEQRAEQTGEALDAAEASRRAEIIGLAALKYYVLRFTPKSTITFDPKKSIDFLGQTGPYCLYAYARIQSLLRKAGLAADELALDTETAAALVSPLEAAVTKEIAALPKAVTYGARAYDPSKVAEQVYKIAKAFSSLYNDREHQIVGNPDPVLERARLQLAAATGFAIGAGLRLLGIETLDQM
jgi:arginyl-tRNA synthetase